MWNRVIALLWGTLYAPVRFGRKLANWFTFGLNRRAFGLFWFPTAILCLIFFYKPARSTECGCTHTVSTSLSYGAPHAGTWTWSGSCDCNAEGGVSQTWNITGTIDCMDMGGGTWYCYWTSPLTGTMPVQCNGMLALGCDGAGPSCGLVGYGNYAPIRACNTNCNNYAWDLSGLQSAIENWMYGYWTPTANCTTYNCPVSTCCADLCGGMDADGDGCCTADDCDDNDPDRCNNCNPGGMDCSDRGGDTDNDGCCDDTDCDPEDGQKCHNCVNPPDCSLHGGDSDHDGICDDADCAPNNPDIPPGCPEGSCDDRGGDADGDGCCDDADCDPADPAKCNNCDTPTDGTYACIDDRCQPAVGGPYRTYQGCRRVCEGVPGPTDGTWDCLDGDCVESIDGQYQSRELCDEDCGEGDVPPNGSWFCDQGRCWHTASNTGEYVTEAACNQDCSNGGWLCVGNGPCVRDPMGNFSSQTACDDWCGTAARWKCYEGSCVPSADGTFVSEAACDASGCGNSDHDCDCYRDQLDEALSELNSALAGRGIDLSPLLSLAESEVPDLTRTINFGPLSFSFPFDLEFHRWENETLRDAAIQGAGLCRLAMSFLLVLGFVQRVWTLVFGVI